MCPSECVCAHCDTARGDFGSSVPLLLHTHGRDAKIHLLGFIVCCFMSQKINYLFAFCSLR